MSTRQRAPLGRRISFSVKDLRKLTESASKRQSTKRTSSTLPSGTQSAGRKSRRAAERPEVAVDKIETVDKELAAKLDCVSKALEGHLLIPASLRTCLCNAVTYSLATCKENRHEFQAVHVEHIGKVLGDIKVSLEEDVAKQRAFVDGAHATKAALEAEEHDIKLAMENLRAASAEAQVPETALADSRSVEDLLPVVDAAKKAKYEIDAEITALTKKRSTLDTAFRETFQPMKVMMGQAKDFKALDKVCKAWGFDGSLLHSARRALKVQPGKRTQFDEMILSQMDEAFQSRVADMDRELTGVMTIKSMQLACELKAREEELAKAESKAKTSTDVLDKTFDSQIAGEQELVDKKKAITKCLPQIKKTERDFEAITAVHERFMSGPMKAYSDLKERTFLTTTEQMAQPNVIEAMQAEHSTVDPDIRKLDTSPLTESAPSSALPQTLPDLEAIPQAAVEPKVLEVVGTATFRAHSLGF